MVILSGGEPMFALLSNYRKLNVNPQEFLPNFQSVNPYGDMKLLFQIHHTYMKKKIE